MSAPSHSASEARESAADRWEREPVRHVPFSGDMARRALDDIVVRVQAIRERKSRLEAQEAALLERAQGLAETEAARMAADSRAELAHRTVQAELGAAVSVTDRTMARHLAQATTLVREYPRTHRSLMAGRVDRARAMAVCEAGAIVRDEGRRRAYEAAALEYAEAHSVNRVRPQVARLAELHADRSLDERHAEALEERCVTVSALPEGMALLQAVLSAADARRVHARLTRCARELRVREHVAREAGGEVPVDPRTVDQQRADALVDIVTGWDGEAVGAASSGVDVRAKVQLVVPVAELRAGGNAVDALLSEELHLDPEAAAASWSGAGPAVLSGHGPIASGDALSFAREAGHWDIVKIRAGSGEVVEVDRYRPSERMRRLLGARDVHCRFPGCRVPVTGCDLDHTADHARGGRTATDNLAHLCRWHHVLKHHSPWRVEQRPGGVLVWTSPTGRVYRDRPVSQVMFRPARADAGSLNTGSPSTDTRPPGNRPPGSPPDDGAPPDDGTLPDDGGLPDDGAPETERARLRRVGAKQARAGRAKQGRDLFDDRVHPF